MFPLRAAAAAHALRRLREVAEGTSHATLNGIPAQFVSPLPLPRFEHESAATIRYPFGARSEAAAYVGALLCERVPALRASAGTIEIVAVARRPGVLSKVAIRPGPAAVLPINIGIGADDLARVSQHLDGERIQVVRWQQAAIPYIADALGLGEIPPMLLLPGLSHARVLLGDIDMRGIAGWRGLNTILASALTGWRIRLESLAATHAWRQLHAAMRERRSVEATVIGHTDRGLRLEIRGLYAILSGGTHDLAPGQALEVRITRMNPDEGRIFASSRSIPTGQLPLPV